MQVYVLYIDDARYAVRSVDSISAETDAEAIDVASRRLAASPHYQGGELWIDDRLVTRLPAKASDS